MTFEKFTKKKSQHSDSKYQGDSNNDTTRDDVKKQRHLKLKMERATSRKQKKEWGEDLN